MWRRHLVPALSLFLISSCGDDPSTATADAATDAAPSAPDSALSAPDASVPACPETASLQLQAALDQVRAAEAPAGVSAAILSPTCQWLGVSGLADVPAADPVLPTHRFRIGSITKTYTAAVILLLVDEGALALSDTLLQHIPATDIPNADTITVEQLLRHTSGIYNFTNGADFDFNAAWTPSQIVSYAAARSPVFPPGTQWEYSNTGYILLGMIIEAASASGETYAQQVRTRLLTPLALDDTFVEGDEPIPGDFVRGYYLNGSAYIDIRDEIDPSAAWSAGAIVATAEDVATWGVALLTDGVLPPALLAQMITPTTLPGGGVIGYGLGMGVGQSPAYGAVQGHSGAIHGFGSDLTYFSDRDAAFVVLVNDAVADPYAFSTELVDIILAP